MWVILTLDVKANSAVSCCLIPLKANTSADQSEERLLKPDRWLSHNVLKLVIDTWECSDVFVLKLEEKENFMTPPHNFHWQVSQRFMKGRGQVFITYSSLSVLKRNRYLFFSLLFMGDLQVVDNSVN